jgi:hypothetical protein
VVVPMSAPSGPQLSPAESEPDLSGVPVSRVWRWLLKGKLGSDLEDRKGVRTALGISLPGFGSIVSTAALVALFKAFFGRGREEWRANFYPAAWVPDIPGYLQLLIPALALLVAYAAERWFLAYAIARPHRRDPAKKYGWRGWAAVVVVFIPAFAVSSIIRLWFGKISGSGPTVWGDFVSWTVGISVALALLTPVIARISPPRLARSAHSESESGTPSADVESLPGTGTGTEPLRTEHPLMVSAPETSTDGGGVSR